MEDYPRNLKELEDRFVSDAACLEYLGRLRWPEGFVCPTCGHRGGWQTKRGLWLCAGCRRQRRVTAGTIFHRSRLPLRVWFRASWWVVGQKDGASALGRKRVLGLGSYETAWLALHKFRRARVRPGREPLGGEVEVDDAYVGGLDEGGNGRHRGPKAAIVVAVEIRPGRAMGRIRLRQVPDVSAASLQGFVKDVVAPGSVVRTDGWPSYVGLAAHGYVRQPVRLRRQPARPHVLLPRGHRVCSLLKRWLLGTPQGAVSPEQLDDYLAEFTFRFNRRSSASRGQLFYRLMQNAVVTAPAPDQAVVKGVRGPGRHRQRHDHNL